MQRSVEHPVRHSYSELLLARRSGRAWPGWLACVLAVGASGAFVWFYHRPLYTHNSTLIQQLDDSRARANQLSAKIKEVEKARADLQRERDELAAQNAQVLKEKQEAVEALNRLKEDLSANLKVEIQSGDIKILRRGNDLVVDVSDKILFDTGKTEIKEQGRKVLLQVASTLARFKDRIIQIGGHTDSARIVSPELRERYPTNWELSTARATNVVRFLQERTKIPGERLAAAGFAEYRPAATNRNEEGRQRNRRIEIVLIPRPPKT
ncbi:MAG: flagellar motor protein MotB [Pseudomonadota bacterium]|nr:MAG: chemotaxis protein MotB [Pseudomonadota bacterium]